jgi:hypothetical protein
VVSGSAVLVTANAGDNRGVVGVQFFINNNPLGAEDLTAPYSVSWNTTAYNNGEHYINAVARDAAGNRATSASREYIVRNDTVDRDSGAEDSPDELAPTIQITSPSNNGTVSGSVTVTANASDNKSVAGVRFMVDDVVLGTDTTAPYALSWNTNQSGNANHLLRAVARDAAGNEAMSAAVAVRVANNTTSNGSRIPPGRAKQAEEGATTSNVSLSVSLLRRQVTTYALSPLGTSVEAVGGQSSTPSSGTVEIMPSDSRTTPIAAAMIGYRAGGVLMTETAVAASQKVRSGHLFVDNQDSLTTGFVLTNFGDAEAQVDYSVIDASGNAISNGKFAIPAQARAFNSPTVVPRNFQGTFTFNSTVPLSVAGFRIATNSRSEPILAFVPAASALPSSQPLTVPQFVAGGGFVSEIVLSNPGNTALRGTVVFYSQGTTTGSTSLVNGGQSTLFEYEIPPMGLVRKSFGDQDAVTLVGSVRIVPSIPGESLPNTLEVMRLAQNGVTVSETVFAATPASTGFHIYAESTGNAAAPVQTGVVIANPSNNVLTARLELLDQAGTSVAARDLSIPGNGQTSDHLKGIFSNVPENFRGTLKITGSHAFTAIGMRTRNNERGEFLFSALPAASEAAWAAQGSSTVLPFVIRGGRYSTDLILYHGGTGGSSNGAVVSSLDEDRLLPR